jgi:hypothetical protein
MEADWLSRIGVLAWTTRLSFFGYLPRVEISSLDVKEQASMRLADFASAIYLSMISVRVSHLLE